METSEAPQAEAKRSAGRPVGTLSPDKWKADTPELIEAAATRILEGKGPLSREFAKGSGALVVPPNDAERRIVGRVVGQSAEDFRTAMSARLAVIANKVGDRVEEKLDADLYKPEHLSFLLAVVLDKKARMDGGDTGSVTVNNQVNIYNSAGASSTVQTREQVLASLGEHGPVTDV